MYYKHITYTDILSHIYLYSVHKEHDKKNKSSSTFSNILRYKSNT